MSCSFRDVYSTCFQYSNELITLKSGEKSYYYVDLRKMISHPTMFQNLAKELKQFISLSLTTNDFVTVPVPHGATPITTLLNFPMLMPRKKMKSYGNENIIEGDISNLKSKNVVIIEDVITTGRSCIEIYELLKDKFNVLGIFSIVQRNHVAVPGNVIVKSMFRLNDFILYREIQNKKPKNKEGRNIVFSADISNFNDFKRTVIKVAPYITTLKTHIDLMQPESFTLNEYINFINEIKHKYDIKIMEDRKFSDIAIISYQQFLRYRIDEWADIITVHPIVGDGFLKLLREKNYDIAVMLVAELSTERNLITNEYIEETKKIALENYNVIGFICQNLSRFNNFKYEPLCMKPGISVNRRADRFDQSYTVINDSINVNNVHYIFGRAIYESSDVVHMTKRLMNL